MSLTLVQNPTATLASSGSSITITSSGAGHLLVVCTNAFSGTSPAITSITDGGDTFVSANCKAVVTSINFATEIWYVLSGAGGKTSVTVNWTGAGSQDVCVLEYSTSASSIVFDQSNLASNQSGVALGPSLTTINGNTVIVASLLPQTNGTTGTTANGGFTFNNISNFDGEGYADLRNEPAGTYQAKWTNSGGNPPNYCSSTASFGDASGSYAGWPEPNWTSSTVGPSYAI